MKKYLLAGVKIMLLAERRFGKLFLVVWPLLSIVLLAICMRLAQLLSEWYGINSAFSHALMFGVFSPVFVLFYTSGMLVADEVLTLVVGTSLYGKEPGSLRKRLRRMVGI